MRRRASWMGVLALLGAACGSSPTEVEPRGRLADEGCEPETSGSPSAFTLTGSVVGDVTVAAPEDCGETGHYIRLDREGSSPIALGRDESGAIRGCQAPPGPGDDACAELHGDALFRDAYRRLTEAGGTPAGIGLGPCGRTGSGDEAFRLSLHVHDWADADAAVRALAEAMRAWDARGPAGVAVAPRICGILLEGTAAADADPPSSSAGDALDEAAEPVDEEARCEALREEFERRLAARTDACTTSADCGCSPQGIVDCGQTTDRATVDALGEIAGRYYGPPRCPAIVRCAPRRCEPVCIDGRCQRAPRE